MSCCRAPGVGGADTGRASTNPIIWVWRFHFGNPETITPVATRHYSPATAGLAALPGVAACPVTVVGLGSRRGYLVRLAPRAE